MSQAPITREYFDKSLHTLREGLEANSTSNTKDIISHFNQSQGMQNVRMDRMEARMDEQFAEVNVKLDAIMKMLVMRQEMHNLVGQLREQGMTLDETKIFVT